MLEIQSTIERRLYEKGASLVGFADLSELRAEVPHSLTYGISIAVALNQSVVARIVRGPTREYLEEYRRVNGLLNNLAAYAASTLEENGYKAYAIKSTVSSIDKELPETLRTPLPHKTVATRAGFGWIGKNALLVTKQYGSAVRLASVLTDAELDTGCPANESRCGDCTECVDVCPVHAPSGRKWNVT
ncbi:MAG: epoxyqueuosine reductase, partial [Candidatus Latescibacteria bacterium]|nr:epoxyqueuosine reductase [Candidatus Latescibacterota bacterium]